MDGVDHHVNNNVTREHYHMQMKEIVNMFCDPIRIFEKDQVRSVTRVGGMTK